MKLISWNVNGLRACLTHDFAASFAALDADIFSVQETKMQPGQADFAPEGYTTRRRKRAIPARRAGAGRSRWRSRWASASRNTTTKAGS